MKKLWLASLWAILLLCLSTGVTLAQSEASTEVPFCGSLTESECASLDATSEAMVELTSGTTENRIDLSFTDGAMGDQEMSLYISGERSFVIKPETLDRLFELKAMPPEELAANPQTVRDAMMLPSSIDRDLTITFGFSAPVLELLEDNFNTSLPAELSFHARVVNNVLYIRLADYEVLGAQVDRMPEWIGIQTRMLISNTVTSAVANQEFDAEDVQDALVPPGASLAGSIVYHVPADDMAAYADFMRLISLGIRDLDGQQVNAYGLTWDIPRYLSGPLFAEQTGSLATNGYPSPASYFMGVMSTVMLDGVRAQMVQETRVADNYVYGVDTEITWAFGIPGGPLLADRPTIGFTSTMRNSDLNAIGSIPVPPGAVVVPLDTILAFVNLMRR
jgi:hypothetical protein